MQKKFALIGVAGYVAEKHLKAIKEVGGDLVAAIDLHDNVGILDSYFPNCAFFTSFERFDRYLDKLKREGNPVDFISICSPNHLHDTHVRYALRIGADAICEKPLTLTKENVKNLILFRDSLKQKKIYNILQLRLHPAIKKLKKQIEASKLQQHTYNVDLTYLTKRGKWYLFSWKGDTKKSGGLATNIGIHFFDMLIWLFGRVLKNEILVKTPVYNEGILTLLNATVHWTLSIDPILLPDGIQAIRKLIIDGIDIDFTTGFSDLHVESYHKILNDEGFTPEDALPGIALTEQIRKFKA